MALSAGFRVCPHPLLVGETIAGQQTRYVRISQPAVSTAQRNWLTPLRDHAVLPLHFHQGDIRQLYAITSERIRLELANMGYKVMLWASPICPSQPNCLSFTMTWQRSPASFQREDRRKSFFRLQTIANYSCRLNGVNCWSLSPANRSLSQFHFEHTRHGHTFKLSPNPFLFDSPAPSSEPSDFTAEPARFAANLLTDDEIQELRRLDENANTSRVERYSGKQPLNDKSPLAIISRHIAHDHNGLAVAQLAADFQLVAQGLLDVRMHKFSTWGNRFSMSKQLWLGSQRTLCWLLHT